MQFCFQFVKRIDVSLMTADQHSGKITGEKLFINYYYYPYSLQGILCYCSQHKSHMKMWCDVC